MIVMQLDSLGSLVMFDLYGGSMLDVNFIFD